MAKTKLPANDLYVGDNQVAEGSDGSLLLNGKKTTVLTKAGTASNGDIVIAAPFEPAGMIVQGLQSTGAPRAFDTAVYDDGDITISVTTGTANDIWSVIIWS